MYPVNYQTGLPAVLLDRPSVLTSLVTLEPSRSYMQPGESRRSPAVIQIRPGTHRPPSQLQAAAVYDRETEDLFRMQEEFILSCQYPLRKLPEESLLAEARISYSHHRKGERSSPEEGGRRKGRHGYRAYSRSPARSWRRRADRSKTRSPRRQPRDYSPPPGAKSPAGQQADSANSLIRNK